VGRKERGRVKRKVGSKRREGWKGGRKGRWEGKKVGRKDGRREG
jgi:hypothetical protein